MDFAINVRSAAGIPIVEVKGELSAITSPILDTAMQQLISDGADRLLIDVTRVPHSDSSGMGVLIRAVKRLRDCKGMLGLIAPQPRIAQLLTVTRLDTVLKVYATEDEALRALGDSR